MLLSCGWRSLMSAGRQRCPAVLGPGQGHGPQVPPKPVGVLRCVLHPRVCFGREEARVRRLLGASGGGSPLARAEAPHLRSRLTLPPFPTLAGHLAPGSLPGPPRDWSPGPALGGLREAWATCRHAPRSPQGQGNRPDKTNVTQLGLGFVPAGPTSPRRPRAQVSGLDGAPGNPEGETGVDKGEAVETGNSDGSLPSEPGGGGTRLQGAS